MNDSDNKGPKDMKDLVFLWIPISCPVVDSTDTENPWILGTADLDHSDEQGSFTASVSRDLSKHTLARQAFKPKGGCLWWQLF